MSHINSPSYSINLFAVTLLVAVSHSAAADTIANKPLYLENDNAIEPNIMFTLDDSGSMEFDYLTPDAEEPSGWQKRSSSFNKLYYNPEVTYRPWINTDGSEQPASTEYPNNWGSCNYTTDSWGNLESYNCYYYSKSGRFVLIYPEKNQYTGGPNRTDCRNKPTPILQQPQ